MRIISGSLRGRVLKVPESAGIRPTSQKVKQALFNILGDQLAGASFLELFAGGGNVGLEAFSRGARRVVLVENNRVCLKAILANLKSLRIPVERVKVLSISVEAAVKSLGLGGERFDFVFLDPPYYRNQPKNNLIVPSLCDILNPQSWVIVEHARSRALPELISSLRLMFTKRYGDTVLSFYQNQE